MKHKVTLLDFLRLASALASCFLWGSYLACWISPQWLPALGLLPMGYPIWVTLCLVAAASLAVARHREAWIPLLTILAGSLNLFYYLGIHRPGPVTAPSFRIMTYNVKYFSYQVAQDTDIPARVEAISRSIVEEQPDILCGQDFVIPGNQTSPPLARLIDEGGLIYRSKDIGDSLILSRYPILAQDSKVFSDSGNSFTWADIRLPQGDIRVFNLHLHSYDLPNVPGRRSRPFRVYWRLCQGLETRSAQAALVADAIAASPYPVVVCGDFNEVPLSYAYRTISRGLVDGFRASGWGSGISYAGPLPWLKIDYILCDPRMQAQNYRIPRPHMALSDHHPAVCDLHWEGPR